MTRARHARHTRHAGGHPHGSIFKLMAIFVAVYETRRFAVGRSTGVRWDAGRKRGKKIEFLFRWDSGRVANRKGI